MILKTALFPSFGPATEKALSRRQTVFEKGTVNKFLEDDLGTRGGMALVRRSER